MELICSEHSVYTVWLFWHPFFYYLIHSKRPWVTHWVACFLSEEMWLCTFRKLRQCGRQKNYVRAQNEVIVLVLSSMAGRKKSSLQYSLRGQISVILNMILKDLSALCFWYKDSEKCDCHHKSTASINNDFCMLMLAQHLTKLLSLREILL